MARKAIRRLTDLVAPAAIARLALPSNLRYGRAIYGRGGVEIIGAGPFKVEPGSGALPALWRKAEARDDARICHRLRAVCAGTAPAILPTTRSSASTAWLWQWRFGQDHTGAGPVKPGDERKELIMPTGVRTRKGKVEAFDKRTGKHKAWCKTERSCKAFARIRDQAEKDRARRTSS